MNATKTRTRLYVIGHATYRLISRDRGWGGPYGQHHRPAQWACIECRSMVPGTDDQPQPWDSACVRNGHAPCRLCGTPLPRLNCGCPREHRWTKCPGKTKADRVQAQHAHKGHLARIEETP